MRFTRGFTNTESQAGARAARHPDRGARRLARMSRGAAPKTPGYDGSALPSDPARVSHWLTDWYVRHPGGVVYLSWHPLPRSSALRASTRWLKNDDPSGAAPLRDRPARGSPLRDRPAGALMRFTRGFTNTESQAGARAARHPGRGARRLAGCSSCVCISPPKEYSLLYTSAANNLPSDSRRYLRGGRRR